MFYPPKSTLQLTLYGFGLVALPLIFSLSYATINVDRLAKQSKNALYQGVLTIQISQSLSQLLISMERIARQYRVLRDNTLLQAYNQNHLKFQDKALELFELPLETSHQQQIQLLISNEAQLFEDFAKSIELDRELPNLDLIERFAQLLNHSEVILKNSNQLIDREVYKLQKAAEQFQKIMFWVAVALIPLTLIFIILFTFLISKPIRQIEYAIRQLGSGKFNSIAQISGPQDLQDLGIRLNWLAKRLDGLEQQKTRFLQHVSHELKTPLTAIHEVGAILGDNLVGPLNKKQTEIVRVLRANTKRLHSLIENLLNFSIAHTQASALNPSRINLKHLVNQVIDSHKPVLMSKSIKLTCSLESIELMADQEKIYNVLDNLLSNAVKFSPTEGEITINISQTPGFAVLDMIDQGPGIAHHDKTNIFAAFYQGHLQSDSHVQGSGLGLSIAKDYIDAHSGTLSLIDTINSGAHFRVQLPLHTGSSAF